MGIAQLLFPLAIAFIVVVFLWFVSSLYLIKESEIGLVEKKMGGKI